MPAIARQAHPLLPENAGPPALPTQPGAQAEPLAPVKGSLRLAARRLLVALRLHRRVVAAVFVAT